MATVAVYAPGHLVILRKRSLARQARDYRRRIYAFRPCPCALGGPWGCWAIREILTPEISSRLFPVFRKKRVFTLLKASVAVAGR